MGKESAIPNAWDDDWEVEADRVNGSGPSEGQAKTSKAERLAKHAEANRQIWESAETPETFHFLAARDSIPLKTEFKPALKVLSRKPSPQIITRQDPLTGLSQMTIEDDEDQDGDPNKSRLTAEELRLKAQRDLEQKQRKYEEVRARLFGTSDVASGSNSSGQPAPPVQKDEGRNSRNRGRGRGRGSEIRGGTKELFDPNYTPKPGSITIKKRDGDKISPERSTEREMEQAIRAPRGPDGSGRGGFGFNSRGTKGA